MRVAIVHEWFSTYAGSEKVVEQILNIWPDADLFSVVDFIPDGQRGFLRDKSVSTTFIQKLPFARKKFRGYLPLMPLAIEQLDLSSYDLIISSSHAVSKGVLVGPDQIHISYVHSPIRYAWDMQHQYLFESGLVSGVKSWFVRSLLHYIRLWDVRSANGVDYFVANSNYISRRIMKCYRRDSTVIAPPVDVQRFDLRENKEDFFLTASRMVPYKKIPLIVEAFGKMPNKKLVVIGDGPEFDRVARCASSNVEILGYQSDTVLVDYMQRAKAFVFAAEEDFGIAPVEAQACGTPVIAFGKGGALDSISDGSDGRPRTGYFFQEQTHESIISAVNEFCDSGSISPRDCRNNALRFSHDEFRANFELFVNSVIRAHSGGKTC